MEETVRNPTSGLKPLMHEQKRQKPTAMQDLGRRLDDMERPAKRAVPADKATRVHFTSDAERNLDGTRYRLGDMVWAKVKSHPWWPGQLYDPNLASSSALELKRDNCFLVAFFGDSTFGWFSESELIPFEPNFTSKSKQTTAPNFVDAVDDALDEVRRRVKLGLRCRCAKASNILQMVEGKPGLLYDRQLSEIRKNFQPAKLFSFIKRLACAPLSSRDMLKSTLAGAEGSAIRILASCNICFEHKAADNLDDQVQSEEIITQGFKDVRIEKGKGKAHLAKSQATPKQQLKVSSVVRISPGLEGGDSSKKKPRKLNTLNEGEPQPRSSLVHEGGNTKKGRPENKKAAHAGEKNAKETSSKSRELKRKESGASKSTSLSQEILPLDACKEDPAKEYSQSGQGSGQLESCEASDSLKLAAENVSAAFQKPDLPTSFEKSHECMHLHKTGADRREAPAFELLARKSPKVKRLVKKVKVFKSEEDSAVKAKGAAEDDRTEGFDASLTKKKNQKLLAGIKHMSDQGNLKVSVTPDSVSRLIQPETEMFPQESGSRETYVERVMSTASAEDAGARCELVVQKEEVIQEQPEGNVVASYIDVEQGVESGSERGVGSFEAGGPIGVSNEQQEENLEGTNTANDVLKHENVQLESREDNMDSVVIEGGEANRESTAKGSRVIEDATFKDVNASCSQVGSGVCASPVLSSVPGTMKEGMSHKRKEPPLKKHAKEVKKFKEPNKETKLHPREESKSKEANKANAPRKRGLEENDRLSKDSRAMTKKLKSSTVEIACEMLKSSEATDVAKLHEDMPKKVQASVQFHDLQEGVLAVTAKSLEVARSNIKHLRQGLNASALGDGGDSDSGYGSTAAKELAQVGEERIEHAPEAESHKVDAFRHDGENQKRSAVDDKIGAASKVAKKAVSFSKTLSSSSISLRPVFEAKSPLHPSRGVVNRFGQRVARPADEGDRFKNNPQEGTLMIKFSQGFPMPSERQLRKLFGNFGDLNEPRTKIDSEGGCARVVFRRMQDAAAALSHMQESPFYENALFWLKSRDPEARELSKQRSKVSPALEKPLLSTPSTPDTRAASGSAKLGSAEKDRVSDGRPNFLDNSHSRKAVDDAKVANPAFSRAKPNTLLLARSHVSEKAPAVDALALGAGIESVPSSSRNHYVIVNEATSSPTLSCHMPGPLVPVDISDRFTALLHQVHDIVESIGFVL